MFISHFNRYFEKHAKITYFVLLIVIIATFVIFVTPGDVLGGNGRHAGDFGTMFGKKIKPEAFQKELNKTTLGLWFQYPDLIGQNFSSRKDLLFSQTLNRMRLNHEAKSRGFDKVGDDDVRDFYRSYAPLQAEGKFSATAFNNLMQMCRSTFNLTEREIDGVVRENIAIERLLDAVRGEVTVTDEDVDNAMAQYTLMCATVSADPETALPDDKQVAGYFAEHRQEIRLPQSRNAMVAYFNYDQIRARHAAQLQPEEAQVRKYYDDNKATLYKDKELAAVKKEISDRLLNLNVHAKARELAGALSANFSTAAANETAEARQARFVEQARKAGAVCQESGWIALGSKVAGKNGEQFALVRAINTVEQIGSVSRMALGADYAAAAMVTDIKDTELPAELNADLTAFIREQLVRTQAMAFFNERVKQPYDQFDALVKEIGQESKGRNPNASERQRLAMAQAALDMQLLMKFYIPESRNYAQVSFPLNAYLGAVAAPTDAELQKAYDENKAEFQKVEVRLATIAVDLTGLEGEVRQAKLNRINEARKQLDGGADFLTVAGQFAENTTIEEKSLSPLNERTAALRDAVAGLERGQLTPIIEVGGQRQIVKMLERRDGRTLAEVRDELIKTIRESQAAQLASSDARKLSDAFSDAWWKAEESGAAFNGDTLLKELVKAYPKAVYAEFDNISPQSASFGDEHPAELLAALFSATEGAPVIEAVTTAGGTAYVGYLQHINAAHLGDPQSDERYYSELRRAYLESAAMSNAQNKAESEIARITANLKEDLSAEAFTKAAAPLSFTALPVISIGDIMDNTAAVKSITTSRHIDLDEAFITELEAVRTPGSFLAPVKAERRLSLGGQSPYGDIVMPVGYQLLYVSGRQVPEAVSDSDKEARNAMRERLLKKRELSHLVEFSRDLEARSNTMLREGVMP